jgi:hypothetical protein
MTKPDRIITIYDYPEGENFLLHIGRAIPIGDSRKVNIKQLRRRFDLTIAYHADHQDVLSDTRLTQVERWLGKNRKLLGSSVNGYFIVEVEQTINQKGRHHAQK